MADASSRTRDVSWPEYVSWVKLALKTPPWPIQRVEEAQRLRSECIHLGEVAERLGCSVFELQAELGIGRDRDVRSYRKVRLRQARDLR